jgi:hypothetical protein
VAIADLHGDSANALLALQLRRGAQRRASSLPSSLPAPAKRALADNARRLHTPQRRGGRLRRMGGRHHASSADGRPGGPRRRQHRLSAAVLAPPGACCALRRCPLHGFALRAACNACVTRAALTARAPFTRPCRRRRAPRAATSRCCLATTRCGR